MRSDAARRREAIVRAARKLFAAHGSTVALDAVAEAAGVGIATLYRNFGSRSELIDVVVMAVLADIRAVASAAAEATESGEEGAWARFVDDLVGLDIGALTEALSPTIGDALAADIREAQDQALADVARVLEAARARGEVDDTLTPIELVLAVGILSRPQTSTVAALAPDLGARLVHLVVRAMTPPASGAPSGA